MATPGHDGTPATLKAVAERAAVSRQTISNALNAPERLKPETLERSLRAVEELGYRPNRAARALRTSSTRTIGFRIDPLRDGINGSVLDRFLHALASSASDAGYHVLLFTAGDDEDEIGGYRELLRQAAVDAFVLASTHAGDERTGWLLEHGAPFVTFGRPWGDPDPGHTWVDVDGARGTGDAVAHLLERGHRRIAFLGWPVGSGVGDDRHAGWRRAVAAAGLPTEGWDARGEDGVATGAALAQGLLDRAEAPTAVVCASDSLAVGAVRALHARGLVPGREVAVTGFDDTPVAPTLEPGLTSVRQPVEAAAREILRLLLDQVGSAPPGPAGTLLAPSLVVRGSS